MNKQIHIVFTVDSESDSMLDPIGAFEDQDQAFSIRDKVRKMEEIEGVDYSLLNEFDSAEVVTMEVGKTIHNAEVKEQSIEGTVRVLAHEVSFWFKGQHEITDELKELLKEEAENRAECCIKEGYVSGELNYENDEHSFRGWWEIQQ